MGMVIGGGIEENEVRGLTLERMSTNIVIVMDILASNQAIFELLYFEDDKPFSHDLTSEEESVARQCFEQKLIMKNNSTLQRISPIPFNPNAQETSQVFIRVYYNQGSFDSTNVISTHQLNIDVICSKDLWLINDTIHKLPLIRPYSIMSRIVDLVGKGMNENGINIGKFNGFKHFTVNEKFECLRLYNNTFGVQ